MGRESKMPCFQYGVQQAETTLRQRFQLQLSADEAETFVETDLIGKSLGSYYTRLYVFLIYPFPEFPSLPLPCSKKPVLT